MTLNAIYEPFMNYFSIGFSFVLGVVLLWWVSDWTKGIICGFRANFTFFLNLAQCDLMRRTI